MSYPVQPADLGRAFEDYVDGYLLTVTAGSATRAVAVQPSFRDGRVVVGAGRSSSANLAERPSVTVLCPPTVAKGFTLLVDGTASLVDEEIVIEVAGAVLHRPPYHADGPQPPDYSGDKAAC